MLVLKQSVVLLNCNNYVLELCVFPSLMFESYKQCYELHIHIDLHNSTQNRLLKTEC